MASGIIILVWLVVMAVGVRYLIMSEQQED